MNFLKLLHVFFLFCWIGSLITLTRLGTALPNDSSFKTQSFLTYRRVYFMHDLPSMILAILTGIILFIFVPLEWRAGWFHMKLSFVVLLVVCDILTGVTIYRFSKNPSIKSEVLFGWLHMLTLLFLILILFSIYGVRNKEEEIIKRYQARQAVGDLPWDR
jgi:protoporphyrinogen IX oxidase